MTMKEAIKRELELRDKNQTGIFSNLSYMEVLALAYKLGVR